MLIDRDLVRAALPGYSIDRELGRGAFGLVIAGRDRLGRDVAIKAQPGWTGPPAPATADIDAEIDRDVAAGVVVGSGAEIDADAGGEAEAEARMLAGLDHPHVVRVFDFVVRDGLALIVMELMTGGSLRRVVSGTLPVPEVCGIGLAVAGALRHAHERGVLHRDLKPSNLLVAADGTVKVADFGTAKVFDGSAATASRIVGTPEYMAPEQFALLPLRPATDLYALGVVLHELLSGRRPFVPGPADYEELRQAHLDGRPAALPEHVPDAVGAVVGRLLAKDPLDRFPDARSFAVALAAAAAQAFGPDWVGSCGRPVRVDDDVLTEAAGIALDHVPSGRPQRPGERPTLVTANQSPPGAPGARIGRLRRGRLVVAAAVTAVAVGAAVPLAVVAAGHEPMPAAAGGRAGVTSPDEVARRLAGTANAVRGRQPDLASRLALAAYRIAPVAEAETSLLASVPIRAVGEPLAGHDAGVNAVGFSPDGRLLATASVDHTVRLWDVHDPADVTPVGGPLVGHSAGLAALAFSPDGDVLASGGDDGTVRLWNVRDPGRASEAGPPLTGEPAPSRYTSAIRALVFSPDGRLLAAGGNEQTVRIWDVHDPAHPGEVGRPLAGHAGPVLGLAFDPDGGTLASAGADGTVRLWDTHDPHLVVPVGQPLDHPGQVASMAFGRDGSVLASAAGTQVRSWDVRDPAHPAPLGGPLAGPTAMVAAVAFDPARPILAVGSYDTTVRLWDMRDPGQPAYLGMLSGHTAAVRATSFRPDGAVLATAGTDRIVRLWDVDPGHAAQWACGDPADIISRQEWDAYVPDLPFRPVCGN